CLSATTEPRFEAPAIEQRLACRARRSEGRGQRVAKRALTGVTRCGPLVGQAPRQPEEESALRARLRVSAQLGIERAADDRALGLIAGRAAGHQPSRSSRRRFTARTMRCEIVLARASSTIAISAGLSPSTKRNAISSRSA